MVKRKVVIYTQKVTNTWTTRYTVTKIIMIDSGFLHYPFCGEYNAKKYGRHICLNRNYQYTAT